jgi:hypothetical protein
LAEDSKRGETEAPPATVENLATPKPALPAVEQTAKSKGYDKEERREMDRLFKNTH